MITNNGIEILSKYLVGQASSYASYIAIGCGSRPTSNSQPLSVVPPTTSVTIGAVTGTGPYLSTLTITGTGSDDYWSYVKVGDVITGTQISSGNLGTGVVTVSSINSPKQIGISSTATMTAGINTLNSIKAYSSLTSQSLASKKNLDFEIARFPISSRSYVAEKQTVSPSSLTIVSPTSVTVTILSGHPFGIGDDVNITGVSIPTSGPTAYIEVNGLYTITAITNTTFTAVIYDITVPTGWNSTMYSTPYTGISYNGYVFYATAYTKQMSLTSAMSDTTQYEISELGLYSLGSNQYSASGNSRMLLGFSSTDGWEYYTGTSFATIPTGTVSIPISTTPYFTATTDTYWNSQTYVKLRQEPPRIFDEGLIVPGALSNYSSGTTFTSNYLRLSAPGVDLSKSSGSDEIRLAYSVINAVSTPSALPTGLYIMFEFVCSDGVTTSKVLFSDVNASTVIYPNRYNVLTKKMSDFVSSSGFDWAKVTSVNVYCAIEAGGTPTNDYAVILDGLRFENTGTENPLYALTAYTVVNNTTASTISKLANSNDLINFRLDLAVGK